MAILVISESVSPPLRIFQWLTISFLILGKAWHSGLQGPTLTRLHCISTLPLATVALGHSDPPNAMARLPFLESRHCPTSGTSVHFLKLSPKLTLSYSASIFSDVTFSVIPSLTILKKQNQKQLQPPSSQNKFLPFFFLSFILPQIHAVCSSRVMSSAIQFYLLEFGLQGDGEICLFIHCAVLNFKNTTWLIMGTS